MSTSSHPTPEQIAPHTLVRRRKADRIAARVHTALSEGRSSWLTSAYLDYRRTRFGGLRFQRILDHAAQVAAGGDPTAVRVSRTPRGHLCVIRLHGPDWSLILTHGRPLPGLILVIDDAPATGRPPPSVWRLDADGFHTQVAAMNLAILAALDTGHHRRESACAKASTPLR